MKQRCRLSAPKMLFIIPAFMLVIFPGCKKSDTQDAGATKRKVTVSSIAALYEAINNAANAGSVIELAAGTYTLDSTYPNAGRLELLENMDLQGQADHPELVIIDASLLPGTSFVPPMNLPAPRTGAIRMGRGENSLQWLTVKGNGATQALSVIDADLIWTGLPKIKILHTIVSGGRIGIDLRNVAVTARGRVLEAEIGNNELKDNLVQFGQAIEVQNANGATGGVIKATLHDNYVHGNKIGLRAFSNNASGLSTDSGSITIQSTNDRFDGNGVGISVIGGLNQATSNTANRNFLHFEATNTSVQNNTGALPPDITDPAPGGIYAAGGMSAAGGDVSGNNLEIYLSACTIAGNQGPGIKVYGAVSLQTVPVLAGTNNTVKLKLDAASKSATVVSIASLPAETVPTNVITTLP